MFLSNSPDTDLIGWIPQGAAQLKNYELPNQTETTLSMGQLKQIFSKESVWILTPLVDLEVHEGQFAFDNQEYTYFARQYFGDSISQVKTYIESGLTEGDYNSPLLLMGIQWVK